VTAPAQPLATSDGAGPCGHTDPVNGCECGDRVRAWWAETLRRLAEASPSRFGDLAQPTERTEP